MGRQSSEKLSSAALIITRVEGLQVFATAWPGGAAHALEYDSMMGRQCTPGAHSKADSQQERRDEGEGQIKVHQRPLGVFWVRLDQPIHRARHC